MMSMTKMKQGDKFWCSWMHRTIFFRRSYFSKRRGITIYEFEDIADVIIDLTEDQIAKLEKRQTKLDKTLQEKPIYKCFDL